MAKKKDITLEVDLTKSPTFTKYVEEKEKFNSLTDEKKEIIEDKYLLRQIERLLYLQLMLKINKIE